VGGYVLEEPLAQGGAGSIHRSRDPHSGHPVALKLLTHATSELARKRFQREAQAMLSLEHPHLVRALASGVDQGCPYLVMELIDGPSLDEVLERDGPLPVRRAAELTAQVARAVAHAHQAGVLHRDLKPANVLLDRDGRARLTDFGLVRDLDPRLSQSRLSKTGIFLGTPGYWAPEQAGGDHTATGPRTDVYGLGALLYGLLTGVPPRGGESLVDAMAAMHQPLAPPSTHRANLPRRLQSICVRCLEDQPDDRPASAAAVAEALEAFLRSDDTSTSSRAPLVAAGFLVLGGLATAAILLGRAPTTGAPRSPGPLPTASPPPAQSPLTPLEAWHAGSTQGTASWRRVAASMRARLDADPDDARAQAVHGLALYHLRQPDEATAQLQAALASAPEDPLVLTATADASGGDVDAQLTHLRRALELDPDHLPALLSSVLPHFLGLGEQTAGRRLLERAAALAPDHPMVAFLRGYLHDAPLDERIAQLTRAVELEPRFVRAWSCRAQAYRSRGERALARADLDRALALSESTTALRESVRWALEDGQDEVAIRDLRRVVELDPDHAGAWRGLGNLLSDTDLDAAVSAYDEGLRRDPEDLVALVSRGTVHLHRGDRAAARRDADRALALAPDDGWGRLLRARLRLDAGDRAGYLTDIEAAARVRDARAAADLQRRVNGSLLTQALLASALLEYERALAVWTLLNQLNPDAASLLALAAADGLAAGEAGSLEQLQHERARAPADPLVSFAYANVLARSGQRDEALRLVVGVPDARVARDPDYLAQRSRAYFQCDRLDPARDDLKRALELDPEHEVAWTLLAMLEFAGGRHQAGLDACDRALALAPGQPSLHLLRANLLWQVGEAQAHEQAFEDGLALEPDHPRLLLVKLEYLRRTGRVAAARAIYERLVASDPPTEVRQGLDALDPASW
jgi:tetratricopeptide (TPR) repeat protein